MHFSRKIGYKIYYRSWFFRQIIYHVSMFETRNEFTFQWCHDEGICVIPLFREYLSLIKGVFHSVTKKNKTWLLFTKKCFELNLDFIGPVILTIQKSKTWTGSLGTSAKESQNTMDIRTTFVYDLPVLFYYQLSRRNIINRTKAMHMYICLRNTFLF